MVTLATQSANGTYDNETDRAQLQKEVAAVVPVNSRPPLSVELPGSPAVPIAVPFSTLLLALSAMVSLPKPSADPPLPLTS